MPLSEPEWPPETALPWLMKLLPEGDPLRAMQRALGVAQEDVLAIISATGGDLAGALSVVAPRPNPGDYHPIPHAATLERILAELPRKPLLAGDDGMTMSLAGAQDKPLHRQTARRAPPEAPTGIIRGMVFGLEVANDTAITVQIAKCRMTGFQRCCGAGS